MTKSRGRRGRVGKTVSARLRLGGILSEGSSEETTEEIAIPDYVMRDFGQRGESNAETGHLPANAKGSRCG